jgi:hypothetical protein
MRNALEIKACPRSLDGQGDREGSHSKGPATNQPRVTESPALSVGG